MGSQPTEAPVLPKGPGGGGALPPTEMEVWLRPGLGDGVPPQPL